MDIDAELEGTLYNFWVLLLRRWMAVTFSGVENMRKTRIWGMIKGSFLRC